MAASIACGCVLVLLGVQWVSVSAHGKLTSPASRNHIDGNAGCSHCLNGGGPCGSSKFLNYVTDPQVTWNAGQVVPVTVRVTAHHMGHYEFRICDQILDSSIADPNACLDKWVMQRASPEEAGFTDCQPGDERPACIPMDPKHPERWYLPPSTEISGSHTIYLKVPAELKCERCTLQWHWWSANSCEPAGDYGCFKEILQSNGYWTGSKRAWWTAFGGRCSGPAGPNGHFGCGEQFWNCADISVRAGSSMPAPSPLPTPPPVQPPMPMPVPMPSHTPAPMPKPPGSCSACAGTRFHSPCAWVDGTCSPILKDMCLQTEGAIWCGDETTPTSTAVPTLEPSTSTAIPAGTSSASMGSEACAPIDICDPSWCNVDKFFAWCAERADCPSPFCKLQTVTSTTITTTNTATTAGAACRASAVSAGSGATDELCRLTCSTIPEGMWPCSSDGPCDCSQADASALQAHRRLKTGRKSTLGNSWLQQDSAASKHAECKEVDGIETCGGDLEY